MSSYHYQPTDNFKTRLHKIEQRDPEGHNRILQVIDRLERRETTPAARRSLRSLAKQGRGEGISAAVSLPA